MQVAAVCRRFSKWLLIPSCLADPQSLSESGAVRPVLSRCHKALQLVCCLQLLKAWWYAFPQIIAFSSTLLTLKCCWTYLPCAP